MKNKRFPFTTKNHYIRHYYNKNSYPLKKTFRSFQINLQNRGKNLLQFKLNNYLKKNLNFIILVPITEHLQIIIQAMAKNRINQKKRALGNLLKV